MKAIHAASEKSEKKSEHGKARHSLFGRLPLFFPQSVSNRNIFWPNIPKKDIKGDHGPGGIQSIKPSLCPPLSNSDFSLFPSPSLPLSLSDLFIHSLIYHPWQVGRLAIRATLIFGKKGIHIHIQGPYCSYSVTTTGARLPWGYVGKIYSELL